MKHDDEEYYEDEYVSRSQKKRDSTALQRAGEELIKLPFSVVKGMPLSADLLAAIKEFPGLKTHEAKRRQSQYIGRLMREQDDPDMALEALARVKEQQQQGVSAFKHVEELRNQLLAENERAREQAFAKALQEYPALEPAHLQHVIQGALAEKQKKRPPRFSRELFRLLKAEDERKSQ